MARQTVLWDLCWDAALNYGACIQTDAAIIGVAQVALNGELTDIAIRTGTETHGHRFLHPGYGEKPDLADGGEYGRGGGCYGH